MTNNERLCGLLGLATRAGKAVFGTEACKSSIEKKKVKLIIMTEDAADRTKTNFKEICNKTKIPIWEGLTIGSLSKAIGKQNKAVIGITDVNFSKEILKIINGGEVIG